MQQPTDAIFSNLSVEGADAVAWFRRQVSTPQSYWNGIRCFFYTNILKIDELLKNRFFQNVPTLATISRFGNCQSQTWVPEALQ
jgi:hypothetical protein